MFPILVYHIVNDSIWYKNTLIAKSLTSGNGWSLKINFLIMLLSCFPLKQFTHIVTLQIYCSIAVRRTLKTEPRYASGQKIATISRGRPVTSLGNQGEQRVFWEGPKFFKLYQIVLNYVQHIFPGGRKILWWGFAPPGYGPEQGTPIKVFFSKAQPYSCVAYIKMFLWLRWRLSSVSPRRDE